MDYVIQERSLANELPSCPIEQANQEVRQHHSLSQWQQCTYLSMEFVGFLSQTRYSPVSGVHIFGSDDDHK